VGRPYERWARSSRPADGVSAEKMQDQIMDKAQKKGAITGLERHKRAEHELQRDHQAEGSQDKHDISRPTVRARHQACF
jgi:hypothetical protein